MLYIHSKITLSYMEPSTDEPESAPLQSTLLIKSIFFILLLCFACVWQIKESRPPKNFLARNSYKETQKELVKPADTKKKKRIYLTFDDGPNKGTRNVLDIIKEENVPVTFFVVGEHVFASPGQKITWDSLVTSKHVEICNHSYSHAWHNKFDKFYQKPDSVISDFMKSQNKLNLSNNLVRTPGRNSWRIDSIHFTDNKKSKSAIDSLQKAGFIVVGWDLEWHYDPKTLQVKKTGDDLLRQIDNLFANGKTKYPDHLVILAHDQVYRGSNDSTQLRQFIQKLKQKDEYEISFISNYPGLAKTNIDTAKQKQVLPY